MSIRAFSFDIGTGSLGESVRVNNEIIEAHSFIIPPDFAETKTQATRRRQFMTRIAHKKREEWLKEQCKLAGIPVLEGRTPKNKKKGIPFKAGDPRLEREFPSKNDSAIYTSCLLRIMLIEGKKLEGWQIYKALHSAIQRRGFDTDVPWKRTRAKKAKDTGDKTTNNEKDNDDEADNREKTAVYMAEMLTISAGNPDFQYPCYYDAFKMGLWSPESGVVSTRIDNTAGRARNTVAPRTLVEKELRALLVNAAVQYPRLKDKIDYIIYGPTEQAYGFYFQKNRKTFGIKEGSGKKKEIKEGTEEDWKGLLGQKIPRFDNRTPDKCCLIPRYNVCRADDYLVIQATFLMKLINLRFEDAAKREARLTARDISRLFVEKQKEANEKRNQMKQDGKSPQNIAVSTADIFSMKLRKLNAWLKKYKAGKALSKNDIIEPPKTSGRSRFSRPALKLLIELILSGESPHTYHDRILKTLATTDPKKGLVESDLAFLTRMPDDWGKIHIPAVSLSDTYQGEGEAADAAVRMIIGRQKNPVVRHRLGFFHQRLVMLKEQYGIPDRVVLEFVRDAFMGEKDKAELKKRQRENKKKRDAAREKAAEIGITGNNAVTKIRLLEEQGCECLYTGQMLSINGIDEYEIDHIVPQGDKYRGADAWWNKVVTTRAINHEKGQRTPHEFISPGDTWTAYCQRVNKHKTALGRKKVRLLLSEHPEEYNERYASLAETAWIARVARDIVCLTFGWQYGEEGVKNRVPVVSGGMTSRIRRKYKLDALLHDEIPADPDELVKKNRNNPLHHALDAMVISFLTGGERTPHLPEGVTREVFASALRSLYPEPAAFSRPALEDTIYGKRDVAGFGEIMVRRVALSSLFPEERTLNVAKAIKYARKILDAPIREQIMAFLEKEPSSQNFQRFLGSLQQACGKGSFVSKVAIFKGKPKEYADFSKTDGHGQYRRDEEHHGQFVCRDAKGKYKVRPVYAFESIIKIREELISSGLDIHGFFRTGCLVEIGNSFDYNGRLIPAGRYLLSSILANGQVHIKSSFKVLDLPVHINDLMRNGFKRIQ